MADIQYKRNLLELGYNLIDLGYSSNNLVINGTQTVSGAPVTTAGYFEKGCFIQNIATGLLYVNTGSTASPVWTIVDTAAGAPQPLGSSHIFVGNSSNIATDIAMTGIVNIGNTGVTSIPLTSAHLLVGNSLNFAASVGVTGDVSLTNGGVTAVVAGAITGAKLSTGVGYFTVAKATNGTTPVNVIAATVPFTCTITGVYLISEDTTAGNITLADTAGTVATIAKGTSSGAMVGATSLANTGVTSGNTLTIVSSSTGNAMVFITFTVA